MKFGSINPYVSGHLFLQNEMNALKKGGESVNPLSIGTPISTGSGAGLFYNPTNVSIPYPSGHPFLRWKNCRTKRELSCVNPPIHRDTHFYDGVGQWSGQLAMHCVNPLSIGTPISTRAYALMSTTNIRIVSIPYPSGHPFLLMFYLHDRAQELEMCQSPIHRDTHFYNAIGQESRLSLMRHVSIPYPSGHPFLPKLSDGTKYDTIKMCQSPIHRDTHFYGCFHNIPLGISVFVSIPYPSGHPFLRGQNMTITIESLMCQSPIHRDTHFYGIEWTDASSYPEECQSPIHRDTHFYVSGVIRGIEDRWFRVNPLSIGTPISTLTPKIA